MYLEKRVYGLAVDRTRVSLHTITSCVYVRFSAWFFSHTFVWLTYAVFLLKIIQFCSLRELQEKFLPF